MTSGGRIVTNWRASKGRLNNVQKTDYLVLGVVPYLTNTYGPQNGKFIQISYILLFFSICMPSCHKIHFFSWFTHFWRKICHLNWCTFSANISRAEKKTLQTLSLFGCVFTGKVINAGCMFHIGAISFYRLFCYIFSNRFVGKHSTARKI